MRQGTRVRVDELVTARGLAETRSAAARLVLAGRVQVDGARVDKAGRLVSRGSSVELTRVAPFVSRGGEKLAGALTVFAVSPAGRVCLDVGASTGGFTDCLLQRGAARVYAVDVGRAQLHERLADDPRVVVLDGQNARYLEPERFDPRPSLATVDVSFISLDRVLPAVMRCLAAAGELVALVKPQFEVGRGRVGRHGVVREAGRHREVLIRLVEFARQHGLGPVDVAASPLLGAKGNREFFLHLVPGVATPPGDQLAARVALVTAP